MRRKDLVKDFKTAFKNYRFMNDEDVVKVALALFIEMVMMDKDKKPSLMLRHLRLLIT